MWGCRKMQFLLSIKKKKMQYVKDVNNHMLTAKKNISPLQWRIIIKESSFVSSCNEIDTNMRYFLDSKK